jgi:hypothetical protein
MNIENFCVQIRAEKNFQRIKAANGFGFCHPLAAFIRWSNCF